MVGAHVSACGRSRRGHGTVAGADVGTSVELGAFSGKPRVRGQAGRRRSGSSAGLCVPGSEAGRERNAVQGSVPDARGAVSAGPRPPAPPRRPGSCCPLRPQAGRLDAVSCQGRGSSCSWRQLPASASCPLGLGITHSGTSAGDPRKPCLGTKGVRTRGRGRGHRAAGRTPGLGQKQRPPPPHPCEGHVRTRPPARETAPCTDGPARDGRRLCGAVDTQFPPTVLSSPAGGAVSTEEGDPALPCPMAPAPVASLPGGSGPSTQVSPMSSRGWQPTS